MFSQVKSFLRGLKMPTRQELELDYLNGAVSHVDLERRQRQIDSGLFRRSAFDC